VKQQPQSVQRGELSSSTLTVPAAAAAAAAACCGRPAEPQIKAGRKEGAGMNERD